MSDLNKRCKSDPKAKCQYGDEIERLRALASEQAEQTVKLNRVVYRMGAALERIAAIPVHHVGWHEIAREALESGDE